MTQILALFSSIKLTITSWLLITAAAIIGGLVVALDIKGGELHKAQLDALEANYVNLRANQDNKTEEARQIFLKTLKEYQDAN